MPVAIVEKINVCDNSLITWNVEERVCVKTQSYSLAAHVCVKKIMLEKTHTHLLHDAWRAGPGCFYYIISTINHTLVTLKHKTFRFEHTFNDQLD